MADETMSGVGRKTVMVRPGIPNGIIECTVGDADEKPGMVVTGVGETHPEVDLCASTEVPLGVLLEREDLDIDTAITAAEGAKGVRVALVGSGCVVYVFYMANAGTAKAGQLVSVASEAGKVGLWSYAEDAEATDTVSTVVGKLLQDVTNDASNDQVVKIILCK